MRRATPRARAAGGVAALGLLFLWSAGCGDPSDVSGVIDVRAPVAVADVQAFPADQKVRVTWSASAEPDLLGYNIYRSTNSADGFQLVGSTGRQQAPFFQDEGDDVTGDGFPDGLANQVRFFYKVTGFDREGRETSLALSATASAVPGVQPGALDDLFVTNVRAYGGPRGAVVTWTPSDATSVYGYFVFRQVLGAPEGFQFAALVPQGRYHFSDGSLPQGSEISYAVVPVTRDLFQGRRVESRVVRVDPGDFTVPKPPGHDAVSGPLILVGAGPQGVTLQWGRPTENTDGSLLFSPGGTADELLGGGFIIYRADGVDGPFEPVGILEEIGSENTFTFTDPRGNTSHFYSVRAFDRFGTLSDESRKLSAGGAAIPEVVRGVDAFAGTGFGSISVNWDLEPTALAGYRVFRSRRRDRGFVQVAGNLPPTQNFFADGGPALATGMTFFYRVAGLGRDPASGELIEGALSDPVPAIAGPSDGVFYLEAEDATVVSAFPAGAYAAVARQAFPEPFSGRGALFVDMAPAAVPDPALTFLDLQWSVEIDASGPLGTAGAYDVYLRVIRNSSAGIFDVRLQSQPFGSTAQRPGLDFFTEDFGFPPRVSDVFLGQVTIADSATLVGNPEDEIVNLRLSYQGFNPGVATGNGELFIDAVVLVRR